VEPPPAITRFCLDGALAPRAARAHVIGVSGPQGGGKSTLTARLVASLGSAGLRAATVSIDDFYRTHAEQRDLAARHPGDRCLEHRGYPGTHDVALGDRVLGALATQRTGSVAVPSYDKSAHGGRGDRASSELLVEAPLDVVLVEGWMLGFRALPRDRCPPSLRASNEYLPEYERWHARLDAFVHLVAGDPAWIVDYRVDAERARRAAGQPALSDDEARDYIERFLPAYEAYVPPLVAAPPCARWLRATIGPDRGIVSIVGSEMAVEGDRSARG
jgi:D-glycerate 3-kinase